MWPISSLLSFWGKKSLISGISEVNESGLEWLEVFSSSESVVDVGVIPWLRRS